MAHRRADHGAAVVSLIAGHAGEPPALLDSFDWVYDSESGFPSSLDGGLNLSSLEDDDDDDDDGLGTPRAMDEIDSGLHGTPDWNVSLERNKSLVGSRLYAPILSGQNSPRFQMTDVSAQQHNRSIGGLFPTMMAHKDLDLSMWDVSMVKAGPDAEPDRLLSQPPHTMTLEELFNLDPVTPLGGTTSASFESIVSRPTDTCVDVWTELPSGSESGDVPSGTTGCGLLPQEFNGYDGLDVAFLDAEVGSASFDSKVLPSSAKPLSTPSPSTTPISNNTRKRRASTACSEAKASSTPAPCPPPPRPSKQKPQTKNTTQSLEIIQYQPADGRLSKKRPAFDEITTGSNTPQTLRRISIEDGSGQIKATMTTFGKRVKSRTPFSDEKRQRTAMARKEGVCARCKRSKRQCDLASRGLYVSCSLCAGSKLYKGVARMPCFRSTLVDILFFRPGPAPNEPLFTRRNTVFSLEDLSTPNVGVRTLTLTQNITSHRLTVYASQFDPHQDDVLSYSWKDSRGQSRVIDMPRFCLTNMEEVQAHFTQYIEMAKWSYLESLKKDDGFSWMTVSMAMEYARRKPDSLVANTLDLWAISRMIEIPWEMCGDDTLGVSRIMEPENPHHGKIPIPPIMDTQLDQIVIQKILKPLRSKVISKFEALISPAKPEAWFEVYLAAFIMLNHIERLAKHSVFHARLHSMRTKYSNASFLEGAFHTAKVILSRFHFVCNGSVPLRLDWREGKTNEIAKLEPSEVEFMRNTQVAIRARENDITKLRNTRRYEQTLYWCHQLYIEDWDKSPVHVIDD